MDSGLNLQFYDYVFTSPDDIFNRLESDIQYLPPDECLVKVKGKTYPISLQVQAFGDADLSYTFSGLSIACQPWTPFLLEIKNRVESVSGYTFNYVLLNRYKDGSSQIGQHKDNEIDMVANHPICSLSFGETRTLIFKRPHFEDRPYELKPNSLLLMKDPTNQYWSHGIPAQKKSTGVRINLTFRMMTRRDTSETKRKVDNTDGDHNKKLKKETSRSSVAFRETDIPDDIFPIGDDVFLYASSFRDRVAVHIRRFKKCGQTFYPTAEGVTLKPLWIDCIAGRKALPNSLNDLRGSFYMPEDEILISSKDFHDFTFTRFKYKSNGESISTSLNISASQWREMLKNYVPIANSVLDHIFHAMNFIDAYTSLTQEPIEETLPSSLDVSIGKQYLMQTLQNTINDLLLEKGLKQPVTIAGEKLGNRVETFNSAASIIDTLEIADSFYYRLWTEQKFLLLRPVFYVTRDFLRNVRLDSFIREARIIFCPADTTEYFDNLE